MSSTEPVDLTNCDREPIHIPGSIQRHGAMLVCDPMSYHLLYASQNAAAFTGHQGVLTKGMDLAEIVGAKTAHDLRNAAAKASNSGRPSLVLGVRLPKVSGEFDVKIHAHEGRAFIEMEPCVDKGEGAQRTLELTQNLIHRIGLENDVPSIANAGAKLVRAMLGYDRVMVYRFLHNGAGRVIAEAKSSKLNSFLGQHFPASDIPYQARRLYLINPIRMIADSSYTPIPLAPPLAAGEAPVDMSFAELRSVSPIHCEYLRNMGVFASLSMSIIVDGELWGLISCHHDEPKVVPLPLRVGAELFGQYFSLQIAVAERRASIIAANSARVRLDGIVAGLTADGEISKGLVERLKDFASLVNADGAALWMNGMWNVVGSAIDEDAARAVMESAATATPRSIWTTQEFGVHHPCAQSSVAGVLAIPLSVTLGDYLMLFRNEEAHNIEWAGEPVKKLISTASGDRLTPRGSFETWRQEVRGRSVPWSESDLSVAEAIRTYLRDVILRQSEISSEERARTEQRRRILNAELNHRVKNIISLVKSIALQTGAKAASVAEYSKALEGRLRALAFAHDQSLNSAGGGDLTVLVEAEASLHRYGEDVKRVVVKGPTLRLDDRAFGVLALVIHEMMTNAAKYGALSVPGGRLNVSWHLEENGDCRLNWLETGGPAVKRPSRDGFGTKLIRSTMEYDLHGAATVNYPASGVRAQFRIPAAHVSRGQKTTPQAQPTEPFEGALAGLSVLVVEDQGLIAMDAEETLRRLGAQDIRLSSTAEDAAHQLERFNPDTAILDFNLGKDTSEAIAEILIARRVPFVFTTGYSDSVMIPPRFRNIPLVRKPINGISLAMQIIAAEKALRHGEDKSHAPESRVIQASVGSPERSDDAT